MICQNCNSQIADTAKFCPICGAPSGVNNEPFGISAPTKKSFWKTGKTSGLGLFFIVFLALCLFLTSFATLFVFNTKTTISSNGIENVIEDVSFENIYDNFEYEIEEFKNVLRAEHNINVSDDTINRFIARSTLKPFIAKKTEIVINEFLNEKYAELTIDSKTAYEFLLENKELLCNEFGMPSLTNNQLYNITLSAFGEREYCIVSSADLAHNSGEIFDIIRVCLADSTFIILIFANLLIIFIMLIINLPKGFKATSIILIIISSIYILIRLIFVPLALSLIDDSVTGASSKLISDISTTFFTASTIISIILLIVCIGGLIYLKIKKSKTKKQSQILINQNYF